MCSDFSTSIRGNDSTADRGSVSRSVRSVGVQPQTIGLASAIGAFIASQLIFIAGLLALSGCKAIELPPGAQAQASSVGVEISPQGPIGPHVTLGSKAVTITTAQPNDQPNLNRLAVDAPGIKLKSTVATGSVGEQIKAAGGLETVLGPEQPATED